MTDPSRHLRSADHSRTRIFEGGHGSTSLTTDYEREVVGASMLRPLSETFVSFVRFVVNNPN
jgi:hypothetical protein